MNETGDPIAALADRGLLIGQERRQARATYAHHNPATGEHQADVGMASEADVDDAVAAARHALPAWQAMAPGALELGGKSANIVFPDADLDRAILISAALGAMLLTGQGCALPTRLYAHDDVYDAVVEGVLAMVAAAPVGDPLDPATQVGPVITEAACERIQQVIDAAVRDGAGTLLTGGHRLARKGYFIEPTVFGDVDHESRAGGVGQAEERLPVVLSLRPRSGGLLGRPLGNHPVARRYRVDDDRILRYRCVWESRSRLGQRPPTGPPLLPGGGVARPPARLLGTTEHPPGHGADVGEENHDDQPQPLGKVADALVVRGEHVEDAVGPQQQGDANEAVEVDHDLEPFRRPHAISGQSGRSGAHGDPLMWLPPSTNKVFPVM
jgi:hypothetical protein